MAEKRWKSKKGRGEKIFCRYKDWSDLSRLVHFTVIHSAKPRKER